MDNESYTEGQSVDLSANNDDVNNLDATAVVVQENMDCSEIERLEREELNRKRSRTREGSSSDDGWNTVSRGRKLIRRSNQEVEEKIQIYVTCSSALPKQFALARLFRDNNINEICRVKYVHQYKILITFDQEADADQFIQCKAFLDLGWRCQKTSEVGLSYGVIKNIDLDLAEEDIIKNLSCDVEIVSAKRLNKRKYKEDIAVGWEKCEAVRLAFKGASLPAYVFIYDMKVKVDPFVFPVTQCSRCWKFGHTRLQCPSKKVVCPKCTKSHENCEKTSFRCVNCTGSHMALEKRLIRLAKCKSWQGFCTSIDETTSSSNMWRKMRWVKGHRLDTSYRCVDKDKAERLLNSLTPDYACPPQPQFQSNNNTLESEIAIQELENSIKKTDTAPGSDEISFSMIKHMPLIGKNTLVNLYNIFLYSGFVPTQWRQVKIIPIPKPGRESNSDSALRPISLISCLCKIFHSILNKRLEWYFEKQLMFSDNMVGFRKARSCFDNLTRLVSQIQIGFSKELLTAACFIDIDNAYNNVDVCGWMVYLDGASTLMRRFKKYLNS
ncbi:reverse transcriptase [Operophtera brumata]|uniref:Reverse transcriptase n=1 Tax=Operophtera brumata TaxID=104452 RepID=A0A0L7L376_OPEBR|nr:reverse transcriptase [Operophtera brumata]